MKSTLREMSTLALLAGVAGACGLPAAGQDCTGASSFSEVSQGNPSPQALADIRPDLSNPGARALAIGGAFIASADDTTSVIANPAGLGALVRSTAQLEGRYNPVVQYDRFDTGQLTPGGTSDSAFTQKDGNVPFFVSGAFPVGDAAVVGVFYQRLLGTSRDVNRASSATRSGGPCYTTKSPVTGAAIRVFVPLYDLHDRTSMYRAGISAAYRLSYKVALGATVYYAGESRDQVFKVGDATGLYPTASPEVVDASNGKVGAVAGLQFTPSQKLRLGLIWSSAVKMATESTPSRPVVRSTVLPMRIGAGMVFAPNSWFSTSFDYVRSFTSAIKDEMNFQDGFVRLGAGTNPGDWSMADANEFRFGVELTGVQTRTRTFTIRGGGWVETSSNLQYRRSDAAPVPQTQQAGVDALKVLYPDESDKPFVHATAGLGLVANKRIQVDVGYDYEFRTKRSAVSALLGYTF